MSLPPLIAAMLRPTFYPHRPRDVTLAQTHASFVLLAGAHVYKIKKPVRFSFLDFSTPELRRHFCHEEVRLNRRLAPNTYYGTEAICADNGAFRLGAEDDATAVEYTVHMRRLPEDRMLHRLLHRGSVDPAMLATVARRLAEFHRQADAGPEITVNGEPAAIQRVLEENFAGTQPFRDDTIAAADDDAIQTFSLRFLQGQEAAFRQRQAEQRIREGHGDLHAEHICFDRELVIFDCIEFNARFRYCDVAADIGFLAMDLDYHERADLADAFVASYVDAAQDAGLRQLLPFYKCYRAYVRGKVDSLKSAETEVAADERERARQSAMRHFALAYRYTWAATPALVAVCGLSGTGKSILAAALQTRTGFTLLQSDIVRKQLFTAIDRPAGYEQGLYSRERTARTYDALFAAARDQLATGHGVILDATFQRRADRDAARAAALAANVPILFVECRCAEPVIRQRLAQRAHAGGPSDADWHVYLEQKARYQAFAADEAGTCLHADTTQPTNAVVRRIEERLRSRKNARD